MLTRISQKVCRDARWQQEADAIKYAPAAIKKRETRDVLPLLRVLRGVPEAEGCTVGKLTFTS